MIGRRVVLAAGVALTLAACDGVSDEQKDAAVEAVTAHAEGLDLARRSGGFYTLVPNDFVRYINLAHTPLGERKHGISIRIVQNDQDRGGPDVLTDSKQILINDPAFFRERLCPPFDVMNAYKEDFEIYINLFSRKFGLNVKVPCE